MPIQPYPIWDFQLILFLQHLLGSGASFFQCVSILLSPPTYFVIAMLLYFLDHKKGVYSLIYLALATFLALALKDIIHHPRPFWTSPLIIGFVHPFGYGMPSGHALFSVYLLLLAILYRKAWGIALSLILIFLVCLSRMVLGVHYAEQILAGLGLGVICLLLTPSFLHLLRSRRLSSKGILLSLIVIFLVALVVLSFLYLQWGMYFEPLPEWKAMVASFSPTASIHDISFFSIGTSFLFCFGVFLALYLEESTLKIQGVQWKFLNFANFVSLFLVLGVYFLSTGVIFLLLHFLSHDWGIAVLGFWIPLFFCYLLPLELAYLDILKAAPIHTVSKARRFSIAFYIKYPYER